MLLVNHTAQSNGRVIAANSIKVIFPQELQIRILIHLKNFLMLELLKIKILQQNHDYASRRQAAQEASQLPRQIRVSNVWPFDYLHEQILPAEINALAHKGNNIHQTVLANAIQTLLHLPGFVQSFFIDGEKLHTHCHYFKLVSRIVFE